MLYLCVCVQCVHVIALFFSLFFHRKRTRVCLCVCDCTENTRVSSLCDRLAPVDATVFVRTPGLYVRMNVRLCDCKHKPAVTITTFSVGGIRICFDESWLWIFDERRGKWFRKRSFSCKRNTAKMGRGSLRAAAQGCICSLDNWKKIQMFSWLCQRYKITFSWNFKEKAAIVERLFSMTSSSPVFHHYVIFRISIYARSYGRVKAGLHLVTLPVHHRPDRETQTITHTLICGKMYRCQTAWLHVLHWEPVGESKENPCRQRQTGKLPEVSNWTHNLQVFGKKNASWVIFILTKCSLKKLTSYSKMEFMYLPSSKKVLLLSFCHFWC